jgi:hypothetical protein
VNGKWSRFKSGQVAFDLYGDPPRLLRIRDRDRDRDGLNGYIIIDLLTRKVVGEDFVEKRRRGGNDNAANDRG